MKYLLKKILLGSLPLVLDVLAGLEIRGWRIEVKRTMTGKIKQVCINKTSEA